MLDLDFEMTSPDLNLNMACDGEFYEPQAIVSSPIVPIDCTVSMECDDDTVSPSVLPEAANTMSCEMVLSSDLDPQRHAIENDCNSNTLCHACGILDDCQCTQQQTDDHNYVSSSIVPIDCTVSMECDDDTVSPVFPEAVNTMSCEMVHSSDLDPQLDAVENDCNNNTLCHACGILDCQCTQQQTGDHNYASYQVFGHTKELVFS